MVSALNITCKSVSHGKWSSQTGSFTSFFVYANQRLSRNVILKGVPIMYLEIAEY